jgi:hypothetical protein
VPRRGLQPMAFHRDKILRDCARLHANRLEDTVLWKTSQSISSPSK